MTVPSDRDTTNEASRTPGPGPGRGRGRRIAEVAGRELGSFEAGRSLVQLATGAIPDAVGVRTRVALMRLLGWNVGRGTVLMGHLRISGARDARSRLRIGDDCVFNVGVHLDLNDEIEIGSGVYIGQDVLILTATHDLGPPTRRAGTLGRAPVRIGDGAWLGARSVVLAGVTVGPGSVVAAGAVVTSDVEESTVVGGVPARVIRSDLPSS